MNSQLAYVQWTKQHFPQVYRAAINKVQRKVALGGLGDSLLSDITFDADNLSPIDSLEYERGASGPSAPAASNDWSNIITSVANAIPTVAGAVIKTKADWDLINLNADNARRGYPLQSSLTHPASASTPIGYMVFGLGALALLVLASRGRSSRS